MININCKNKNSKLIKKFEKINKLIDLFYIMNNKTPVFSAFILILEKIKSWKSLETLSIVIGLVTSTNSQI